MEDDYFTLVYNEKRKKVKIPNTFEELEKIFKTEFSENDVNTFNFQYIDSDEDEILLDKDNYNASINDIKQITDHLITINKNDKENNVVFKSINYEIEGEEEEEEEKKNEISPLDPLKSGTNFSKLKKKEINKTEKKENEKPDNEIKESDEENKSINIEEDGEEKQEIPQLDPLKSGTNFSKMKKKENEEHDISDSKKNR